jgi:transcriptional regulator with XRE-family HTH domain
LTTTDNIGTIIGEMDPRPLNELLRELREQQGRSLRQAARALEVDPAYLSRVERGEKPASPAVLRRASTYYEVPEEYLALSRGRVPEDIVEILQRNPNLLEELRARHGPG